MFPPTGTFFDFDVSMNTVVLCETLFPFDTFFFPSSLSNNNSSDQVFSVFYVSDRVLNALHGLSCFLLTKARITKSYDSHFSNEGTKFESLSDLPNVMSLRNIYLEIFVT